MPMQNIAFMIRIALVLASDGKLDGDMQVSLPPAPFTSVGEADRYILVESHAGVVCRHDVL